MTNLSCLGLMTNFPPTPWFWYPWPKSTTESTPLERYGRPPAGMVDLMDEVRRCWGENGWICYYRLVSHSIDLGQSWAALPYPTGSNSVMVFSGDKQDTKSIPSAVRYAGFKRLGREVARLIPAVLLPYQLPNSATHTDCVDLQVLTSL